MQSAKLVGLTRDLAESLNDAQIPPRNREAENLARELVAAREQLASVCDERNAVHQRIAALEQASQGLMASRSWRLTAPLRTLKVAADRLLARMRNLQPPTSKRARRWLSSLKSSVSDWGCQIRRKE